MADKNAKIEPVVTQPVAVPVEDGQTRRYQALAELWGCTFDEAKAREEARLAAKKQKAAAL